MPEQELVDVEEFDEDIVKELRNRARDALLTKAIATEEKIGDARPSDELLEMEGLEEELAYEFAAKGIVTMEDLAEQAVDDLMEFENMDEQLAAQLIMKAREPWFEAAEENAESDPSVG